MDPNTALLTLRGEVQSVLDNADESTSAFLLNICELFDSLDGWMSKGGFLPDAWEVNR